MEWKHLTEVLERYGDLLCTKYKTVVPEASGALAQSARYEVRYDGSTYEVGLWLEDYWRYVENGRRSGKFPPLDKIEQWIKVKPVLPRAYNGKLPTERQLAFLIGRKIALEGTQGTHPLERSVEDVNSSMLMSIQQAIIEDIGNDFRTVLVMLGNKK